MPRELLIPDTNLLFRRGRTSYAFRIFVSLHIIAGVIVIGLGVAIFLLDIVIFFQTPVPVAVGVPVIKFIAALWVISPGTILKSAPT